MAKAGVDELYLNAIEIASCDEGRSRSQFAVCGVALLVILKSRKVCKRCSARVPVAVPFVERANMPEVMTVIKESFGLCIYSPFFTTCEEGFAHEMRIMGSAIQSDPMIL